MGQGQERITGPPGGADRGRRRVRNRGVRTVLIRHAADEAPEEGWRTLAGAEAERLRPRFRPTGGARAGPEGEASGGPSPHHEEG